LLAFGIRDANRKKARKRFTVSGPHASRCLSGRTNGTHFDNNHPGGTALFGIAHIGKYFCGDARFRLEPSPVAALPLYALTTVTAVRFRLPAAGSEPIAVVMLFPAGRFIALPAALAFPVALRPDVLAVLPAPEAGRPQVAVARGRNFLDLHGRRGRSNDDANFGESRQRRRAEAQRDAQYGTTQGGFQPAARRCRCCGSGRRCGVSNICNVQGAILLVMYRTRSAWRWS